MVEKEKEEKKVTTGTVELVEVPTQMGTAIKLPDGSVVTIEQFFAWLGQQVFEIRRNL